MPMRTIFERDVGAIHQASFTTVFCNKMRGLIIAFLVTCIVHTAQSKLPVGKVIKEDLAHISCEVCERVVEEIFLAIDNAKATKPRGVLDELNIVEIIESISNPSKESGEWIKKLDIIEATVKDKNYLSIIEPGGSAKCLNECTTIAQSSQNLLQNEIDADDLSALLWKNKESPATLKVDALYFVTYINSRS